MRQSARLGLRVNDLLFVNEYLRNGRNATQAYRVVHPKASWACANVQGCRRLATPSVKNELARRLQVDGGITRDFLNGHLLRALDLAGDDALKITTVCRELGDLAGLKVQKVADVSDAVNAAPPDQRRALVAAALDAVN